MFECIYLMAQALLKQIYLTTLQYQTTSWKGKAERDSERTLPMDRQVEDKGKFLKEKKLLFLLFIYYPYLLI